MHLLTHATKDIEVFEERNDVVVDAKITTQPTQRGEIVNPPRTKKHQFAEKVKAEKKVAAAKGKGKLKAGSDSDDDADVGEKKPVKKVVPAVVPKVSPARVKGKGKGKAPVVELASDSEIEFESGAESLLAEEDVSDDESEAVSTADEATKVRPSSSSSRLVVNVVLTSSLDPTEAQGARQGRGRLRAHRRRRSRLVLEARRASASSLYSRHDHRH